jgi:hypothetical protein
MKVILEVKNRKVDCSKLKEYFKKICEMLPTHRIEKIYGINNGSQHLDEQVLLMKSSHNVNQFYHNDEWQFDKLDIIVKKKHIRIRIRKTQLESIKE